MASAAFRNGVRVEVQPADGVCYTFPAAQHVGFGLGMILALAAVSATLAALIVAGVPRYILVVMGLIDAGVFWGVLLAWCEWRQILIQRDSVVLRGGVFGLAGTRTLARDKLERVHASKGSTYVGTTYYRIKLFTVDGRSFTIGKGITGLVEAETLTQAIRTRLELPATPDAARSPDAC